MKVINVYQKLNNSNYKLLSVVLQTALRSMVISSIKELFLQDIQLCSCMFLFLSLMCSHTEVSMPQKLNNLYDYPITHLG